MPKISVFASVIMLIAVTGGPRDSKGQENAAYSRIVVAGNNFGYVLQNAIWKFPEGKPKIIFVCWENPSARYRQRMDWVRDSVSESWQKVSALMFVGWEKACTTSSAGIHIRIGNETSQKEDDYWPHTKGLGNELDGKKDGMLLNLDFDRWSSSCVHLDGFDLRTCIQSVAVHEFGHALGFAHEQNRSDTPGECNQAPQGKSGDVLLTPFDPRSVMNYCNPKYNNNGILSEMDVVSIQKIYCPRSKPECHPEIVP